MTSLDLSPVDRHPIKIISRTMNDPALLPNGTTFGNYSYTLPNKMKLIPYQYARRYQGHVETETGYTRVFLNSLPKPKFRKSQFASFRGSRPPLVVYPSIIEHAVYVDLRAAYPSIYKLTGWQVEYKRGDYLGINDSLVYPFPEGWKVGRSYVVTGAIPRQFSRIVKDGKIIVKPYYTELANPSFVACVYDVLGMIARFAVYALDARYWNTDGGIMRREAYDYLKQFTDSLGLEARIKYEGRSIILSSGYWQVGPHQTKRMQLGGRSEIRGGDYNSMSKEESEWLYNKLSRSARV